MVRRSESRSSIVRYSKYAPNTYFIDSSFVRQHICSGGPGLPRLAVSYNLQRDESTYQSFLIGNAS